MDPIPVKTFHLEPLEAIYYWEENKAKYLTWNSIRFKFAE